MDLTANLFLVLAAALFIIGMMGVLTRRNVLVIMMSVEMMVSAVSLTFITFANETNTMYGHVFVLFALAVAAAEAGVGLAIVVALSRAGKDPDINEMQQLHD